MAWATMAATRACWSAEMTGPTAVSGSVGSPVTSASTDLPSPATTPSKISGPAITRQGAVQSWPEL